MTPKRKQALQYIHDRGEVISFGVRDGSPSRRMIDMLVADGLVSRGSNSWGPIPYTLTDKGRRALHEN